MATRIVLKQRIARILNRSDESVALIPVPSATTILGTTATVRDTTLARGTTAAERYDHRHVEIIEAVTDPNTGPLVGEVAVVTNGGFDKIDQLTVSPAFSNAVQIATDYIIWPKGVAPEMINQHINDLLRATYHPYLWIPTLVDDADFEESDLTNWADVGSPSPATAFTTTAADVLLGERAIKVQTDATGEGITSNDFRVTENEQLMIVCYVRAQDDAVIVSLYDSTANSDVTPTITIDEQLYTEARMMRTVADDMEIAQIRFIGSTNASEFYVGAHVIVQSFAGRPHALPSWLVNPRRQIEGALYLRQGYSSEVADSFIALSQENESAPVPVALRSDRSLTPGRVILQADTRGPIAFKCRRPFAELTSDTGTTNADEDYVAYGVVARLLRDKGDDGWRDYRDRAREIAVARGYGDERRMVIEENPKVLVR